VADWWVWAIRLVSAALMVTAWVWAMALSGRALRKAAYLPSVERKATVESASLRIAVAFSIGMVAFFVSLVPLDTATFATDVLPMLIVFLGLGTSAIYIRVSWSLRRSAWYEHMRARETTPFGVGTVACTECGQSSEHLRDAELDTGDRVPWVCHHCGAANTISAFDFCGRPQA